MLAVVRDSKRIGARMFFWFGASFFRYWVHGGCVTGCV